MAYAQTVASQNLREMKRLQAENAKLLAALKDMCAMYTYVWDVVDGGLFCAQDNVQRFDTAHEKAHALVQKIETRKA